MSEPTQFSKPKTRVIAPSSQQPSRAVSLDTDATKVDVLQHLPLHERRDHHVGHEGAARRHRWYPDARPHRVAGAHQARQRRIRSRKRVPSYNIVARTKIGRANERGAALRVCEVRIVSWHDRCNMRPIFRGVRQARGRGERHIQ